MGLSEIFYLSAASVFVASVFIFAYFASIKFEEMLYKRERRKRRAAAEIGRGME